MSEDHKKATRKKVRAYRDRMRKEGLRPLQVWVPDVRADGFAQEAHRQSVAVGSSEQGRADQAWVDAVSEWDEE